MVAWRFCMCIFACDLTAALLLQFCCSMDAQHGQYGHPSTWPAEWQIAVVAAQDPSMDIDDLPSLWRERVIQWRREASVGRGGQGADMPEPETEEQREPSQQEQLEVGLGWLAAQGRGAGGGYRGQRKSRPAHTSA